MEFVEWSFTQPFDNKASTHNTLHFVFIATGGGLTFGGGESLVHIDFISHFRQFFGNDWSLCAETSLAVSADSVRKAAYCIDSFIVDIKTTNSEIYTSYTRKDCCSLVLSNLELLLSLVSPEVVKVRIPIIPGYTSPDQAKESARIVQALGATDIDIFAYRKIPHENETTTVS